MLDLRLCPEHGGPTNLRSADFSRNRLDMLRDLAPFSRLAALALAHNRIERLGADLRPLSLLKVWGAAGPGGRHACSGLEYRGWGWGRN